MTMESKFAPLENLTAATWNGLLFELLAEFGALGHKPNCNRTPHR